MSAARIEAYSSSVDLLAVDMDGAVKKLAVGGGSWPVVVGYYQGFTAAPTIHRARFVPGGDGDVQFEIRASATLSGASASKYFEIDVPIARINGGFADVYGASGTGSSSSEGKGGFAESVTSFQLLRLWHVNTASSGTVHFFYSGSYSL